LPVLIVGAGPTGLALAAQLLRFEVPFRIIDRSLDRVNESRALAVQARSVEILQTLGLADALVARGNRSARLMMHLDRDHAMPVNLAEFKRRDTRFPFILFVSQSETEAVLGEHLLSHGVRIERATMLVELDAITGLCRIRHADGSDEELTVQFVAGCDGSHSTVRKLTGVAFRGDAYLQQFVLGDVEIDGPLEADTVHAFPGSGAVTLVVPLGSPRTWRVIAASADTSRVVQLSTSLAAEPLTREASLEKLQAIVDIATEGILALKDPAWLADFYLHHRQAAHYRAGIAFLAGDAAHIHSPVGAQGMNTGIQDAWNLGWKLALVVRGQAHPALLDSYEAERWPIGRILLRTTDRLFSVFIRAISRSRVASVMRRRVVRHVAPFVLRNERLRRAAFDFVSQLGIRYRRSPVVEEGMPHLERGPKAGDRLPDFEIERDGQTVYLQDLVASPGMHLLLCGPADAWDRSQLAVLKERYARLLSIHFLVRRTNISAAVDRTSQTLAQLGVGDRNAAQYLVRPDGHIAFRCGSTDLAAIERYLALWFVSAQGQL
jgi:2-polyprenyl-6-methoxyphenol hydroxylase-like FAD-dependent oxidoreductase